MSDFPVNIRVDRNGAESAIRSVTAELSKLETSTVAAARGLGTLAAGFGAMAAAAFGGVKAMVDFNIAILASNDHLIEMRNVLRGVTKGHEELTAAMNRTRAIADATLTDWKTTADVYARTSKVVQQLGFTADRTGRFVEILQKMMGSSGRSSTEASSAMLQFSQALGSGVLQGDEFKSISENMPSLLDAFAKQLGVTRGELKKLASDGKITGDVMVKAIESMGTAADVAFAQMERTLTQRMQPLLNEMQADPRKLGRMTGGQGWNADMLGAISQVPDAIFKGSGLADLAGIGLKADVSDIFDPQNVTEYNRQIGETTTKLDALYQRLGGKAAKTEIKSFEDQVKDLVAEIEKTNPALAAWNKEWSKILDATNPVAKGLDDVNKKLDEQNQKLADQKALLSFGKKLFAGTDPFKQGSGDLWLEYDADKDPLVKAAKKREAASKKAAEEAAHAWKAFEESINGPARNAAKHIDMLVVMYQRGTINAAQFNEQLAKQNALIREASSLPVPPIAVGAGKLGGVGVIRSWEADPFAHVKPYSGDPTAGFKTPTDPFAGINPSGQDERAIAERQMEIASHGDIWKTLEAKGREYGEFTEKASKDTKQLQELTETAFQSIGDSLLDMAKKGEFSFKTMVDAMINDLGRLAMRMLVMRAAGSLFGGLPTTGATSTGVSPITGLTGGVPGGATGATWTVPHFATGGTRSYMARGPGGLDSIPIPFGMVSPGETVTVTPRSAPTPSAPAPVVNTRVIVQQDPRALLDAPGLDERIERVVLKMRR